MISLYTDAHRYTSDAQALDNATGDALKPLFADFVARGYSPREVAHIMQSAVTDLELESLLLQRRQEAESLGDMKADYDTLKAVFVLQRDKTGAIIGKLPILLDAFTFLVDKDGNVPEPPYPACQIQTQGLPLLLTKDDIEVQYNEDGL